MSRVTRNLGFVLFLVLPLAIDPLRCAVPRAEAATTETPSSVVITEGKTAQGFPYLCGGVGSDEREIMEGRSATYNVKLSFAAKGGAFLSDVTLVIADAKSGELVSLITDGPLFFILKNARRMLFLDKLSRRTKGPSFANSEISRQPQAIDLP